MDLREIIKHTKTVGPNLNCPDFAITGISSDSRAITSGNLFVALPGPKTHGAKFVQDAIFRGAKVIAYEKDENIGPLPDDIHGIPVTHAHDFLVDILKTYYQEPAQKMCLVGVTGTNGKTTITYLLESLLTAAGQNCGVIGTVNFRYAGNIFKAGNTTPGLVENYSLLAKMLKAGTKYCAMEVSSHALDQRRVDGLSFRYGIFTNLTSDHMDYHKDQETYFRAKAKLFTALSSTGRAIINGDDPFGIRLTKMTSAPVWTYGIKGKADIMAKNIQLSFDQSSFELVGPTGKTSIVTKLIGVHNIYNILAVAGVGIGENMPLQTIKAGLESLQVVPGRLERVEAGQDFHVFVDYAHTEDALQNVLSSLRQVSKARITVVFGCGGDRDRMKRPKMAAVVDRLADRAIVTTDNPRSEDPQTIIDEILTGFKSNHYQVVIDREEAIAKALHEAQRGEVVLIAGKGHEDYQIFKDRTIAFDERAVVRKHLTRSVK